MSESNEVLPTCIGCGLSAPTTTTTDTLISRRHGWRLMRTTDKSGVRKMEWRCPGCWALHRKRAAG